MKRANRLEICSSAFERKIRADHFDNIIRGSNLLDHFRRDRSHALLVIFASFDFRSDAKLTQCGLVSKQRAPILLSSRAPTRDPAKFTLVYVAGFFDSASLRSE